MEIKTESCVNCTIKSSVVSILNEEELGVLTQNYLSFTGRGRSRGKTQDKIKEGFAEELADMIGMILLKTILSILATNAFS